MARSVSDKSGEGGPVAPTAQLRHIDGRRDKPRLGQVYEPRIELIGWNLSDSASI
jgi:hypothetical protein